MTRMWFTLALAHFLLLVGSALGQGHPEPVRNLEWTRGPLETAHIEWSWWKPERSSHFYFYTSRIAGDEIALDQRGDEEGVFGRRSEDQVPARSIPVHRTLRAGGQAWQYSGLSLSVDVYPVSDRTPSGLPDLRALGMSYMLSLRDVHDTLWFDGPQASPRKYRVTVENGLHVVRALTDQGEITWYLDPERGWCPVRVTCAKDGKILQESRSTLTQFDGVWFPQRVVFFRSTYEDGKEPCEVVRIHSASLNQPEHPLRLTPGDIGIDACFNVAMHDENGKPVGLFKWDGERIITIEEWNQREEAGELKPGPHAQRLAGRARDIVERARERGDPKLAAHEAGSRATDAGLTPAALVKRSLESQWEAYARHFIERYRLNKEQSDKAWAILKDCQERANRYLAKREKDFEKLDKEAEALKKSDAKDRAQRLAAIDKRHRKLMQPIDEIFEKQLKPRLEKLPTRAQRRAEEEREKATSKPAKAGGGQP